jgi:hypothetical protein
MGKAAEKLNLNIGIGKTYKKPLKHGSNLSER